MLIPADLTIDDLDLGKLTGLADEYAINRTTVASLAHTKTEAVQRRASLGRALAEFEAELARVIVVDEKSLAHRAKLEADIAEATRRMDAIEAQMVETAARVSPLSEALSGLRDDLVRRRIDVGDVLAEVF